MARNLATVPRLSIRNSGLEVWLYDDANHDAIRARNPAGGMGGMPHGFDELTRQGLVVGYSLQQDDDLEIAVDVGEPLTENELAVARWLEPQTALLRLPSGRLRVESNDASRIGPEQPTEQGGRLDVPPGDYRVTLYRIDHEALFREGATWEGPEEVLVLTPGGTPADAAEDLLPHQARRDTNWVGKYTITGRRTAALVWFDNYWDWFVVNLDPAAVSQLGIVPGAYLRTQVPAAGLTLISVFAGSWDEAERLPPPMGLPLEEYGYAALQRFDDWGGAEALFCRRATIKTRVEAPHHYLWQPAVVEVLDAQPEARTGRMFAATDLRGKQYFDAEFLTVVFSAVVPEIEDLDELPLAQALDMLDQQLAAIGLAPQGDVSWNERIKARPVEATCRLYAGLPDGFGAIVAGDGSFEVVFLSELDDGTWVATGFADEINRRITTRGPDGLPVPNPRVRFQTMDQPLADIFAAHQAALRQSERRPVSAPVDQKGCVAAFGRFLEVAFGPQ